MINELFSTCTPWGCVVNSIQFTEGVGETIQSNKAAGLHWVVLLDYFIFTPSCAHMFKRLQICPKYNLLHALFHSWHGVCVNERFSKSQFFCYPTKCLNWLNGWFLHCITFVANADPNVPGWGTDTVLAESRGRKSVAAVAIVKRKCTFACMAWKSGVAEAGKTCGNEVRSCCSAPLGSACRNTILKVSTLSKYMNEYKLNGSIQQKKINK